MEITFRVTNKRELYELRDLLALLKTGPETELIADLGLTTYSRNLLHGLEIVTINDLLGLRPNDLLKQPNLGRRTLDEIREKLAAAGYDWQE